MSYFQMSKDELQKEHQALSCHFASCKAQNLKLNMARGKPGAGQLDLVSDILSCFVDPAECFTDGIDARNYGELAGLPVARAYWADMLGCKPEQTFLGGTASLNLMYDEISRAYTHGLLQSERTWSKDEVIKIL